MGAGAIVNPAVQSFNSSNRLVKTITFDGTAGNGAVGTVALYSTTGTILIRALVPICTTDLAGANAVIALGTTESTAFFAAAATATLIDANEYWYDSVPSARTAGLSSKDIVMNNTAILYTITVADITAGVITVTVYWDPISDGAVIS